MTLNDLTDKGIRTGPLPVAVPVDGEEQGQGGHRLLPSREVVHGPEPLPRGHAVIVDAVQVGLLWVLWAEESLATGHN